MKSMLKSLMSVAVAALAFTSCSNDATEEIIAKGELKTLEVSATIDQTRTTLDVDHNKLQWADGDQIHLYIGTNTTEHSTDPNGGTIENVTYNPGDKVYAYYSLPESGKSSSGAKNVLINIVQKQTQPAVDVFEGKNMPMIATGDIVDGKVKLAFQPIGCVLVFNVYGQGKNAGEKIKSIKFETSTGCYGYAFLDLIDGTEYKAYNNATDKSVTVTLTDAAPIVATKPEGTQKGSGNQVYMVVAPVDYPAGSKFTVTTDAAENNTYTFTTTTALACSQSTARVVNLNLAKSAEIKPAIEVPKVPLQESAGGELTISPITFTNITNEQIAAAEVGVYSDEALAQTLENSWITINNSNPTDLSRENLKCAVAENTTTEERTAYIGIKCLEGAQVVAQAAIAVKQLGKGAVIPDPTVAEVSKIVTSGTYKEYETTDWIVTCGGGLNEGIASLGSNSTSSNVAKCYLYNYEALANAMGFTSPYNDSKDEKAAAIISKNALPAGYNTVKVEYNNVKAVTQVAIAFSTDNGATWTRIMEFTALGKTDAAGSQTYSFPQQGAGRYAFVAQANADNSRITNCKITYSQE